MASFIACKVMIQISYSYKKCEYESERLEYTNTRKVGKWSKLDSLYHMFLMFMYI